MSSRFKPHRRAWLVMIAAVAFGAAAAQVTAQEDGPDPGFIPGAEYGLHLHEDPDASGYAVFPAEYKDGKPVQILDPAGFHLILTDAETPGEENYQAAGELLEPPLGRYRFWLEGEWEISPYTQLVSFGKRRAPGSKSLRTMPVVPAGRVTVDREQFSRPGLQLRVLHADDPGSLVHHELSRRSSVNALGGGILMPQGLNVAALWDPRERSYIALSRPFHLRARDTVEAPVGTPPANASHLVVYVDRPRQDKASDLADVELSVRANGDQHLSAHQVRTPWGIYAFWYDLPTGKVVLTAAGGRLYLDPTSLELSGGRIHRFQDTLSRRPFLDD